MWSAWECVSSVFQVLQLHKCSYCTCDGFRKGRTLRDKVILFFLFFISSGCQLPKFVISVVKKRKEKKNIRAYYFVLLWSGENHGRWGRLAEASLVFLSQMKTSLLVRIKPGRKA